MGPVALPGRGRLVGGGTWSSRSAPSSATVRRGFRREPDLRPPHRLPAWWEVVNDVFFLLLAALADTDGHPGAQLPARLRRTPPAVEWSGRIGGGRRQFRDHLIAVGPPSLLVQILGGHRVLRNAGHPGEHRRGHLEDRPTTSTGSSPHPGVRDRDRPAGRGLRRAGPAGHPVAPVPQLSGSPPPPWPRPRCSPPCGGRSSGPSTGASTAPATTRTRPSPRSRPG